MESQLGGFVGEAMGCWSKVDTDLTLIESLMELAWGYACERTQGTGRVGRCKMYFVELGQGCVLVTNRRD